MEKVLAGVDVGQGVSRGARGGRLGDEPALPQCGERRGGSVTWYGRPTSPGEALLLLALLWEQDRG